MAKITVYGREGCGYCIAAQALLERKGIDFDYFKVGVDISSQDVIEKAPTARTVPVVFFDDEYVGGFHELKNRIDPDASSQDQ